MTPKPRRDWKRLQPTSLRQALELCKDHAKDRKNRSVEQIAEEMGLTDHWVVYKWLQTGRIPANLIRPFERACGISYVTRWLAASGDCLLVPVPTGKSIQPRDLADLGSSFGSALKLLTDFYSGKADQAATTEALTNHLNQVAYHHANVGRYEAPELDFDAQ